MSSKQSENNNDVLKWYHKWRTDKKAISLLSPQHGDCYACPLPLVIDETWPRKAGIALCFEDLESKCDEAVDHLEKNGGFWR